jgi:predicted RNase H-like HicB family nuclease
MSYSSQVNKMKLDVTIFQDEDGMFIAECPSVPGCVSQGKTGKEAISNIREAVKECLEVRAEKGLPLTIESHHIEINV